MTDHKQRWQAGAATMADREPSLEALKAARRINLHSLYNRLYAYGDWLEQEVALAIDRAVAAERERCAVIADATQAAAANPHQSDRDEAADWADCAAQIAWEIRGKP